MYGTVARFKAKPGMEDKFGEQMQVFEEAKVPGAVATTIYRMDKGSNEFYIAVIFDSKESYFANANSPEQNTRYEALMEMMTEAPEWHDGEVVAHNMYNR